MSTQEIRSSGFARLYNMLGAEFTSLAMPSIRKFYETTEVAAGNRRLLDVCCGTGQLAKYFLDNGYEVTGVDLSAEMLEFARSNAGEHIAAGRARFERADASNFSVGEGFGLVTVTYNSLNQLQSQEALFGCQRSVYAHLAAGGYFIFDMLTRNGFLQDYNAMLVYDTPDLMYVHRGVYGGGAQATARQSGFVKLEDGGWERFDKYDTPMLYAPELVLEGLKEAGFADSWAATYDHPDVRVEDPNAATRVVFVARKS